MRRMVLGREQAARGPLLLVNAAHPLPDEEVPQLARVGDSGVQLERETTRLLNACIHAAGGWRDVLPVSGWRSRAEQQSIWDETLAREGDAFTRQYVAPPGCSEHETGLAIDLGARTPEVDFIRPDFPDHGACGAFRRLAAEYGFIQRYRWEKERLTGIAGEPWHFRYVGVPHARLMEERDLCLEEYGDFLRAGPRTCTLPGGGEAAVSYLPCPRETVEITLPENIRFQVSGYDGGLILTAWEAGS